MDYKKIHDAIINRAKNRIKKDNELYEYHHIIPQCIDTSLKDDPNNCCYLTYREHYIIHQLLVKIYTGVDRKKLIYALKFMTVYSDSNNYRSNNRLYERYRKLWMENHPCKDENTKNKISNSLKFYYKNNPKSIGYTRNKEKIVSEIRYCLCGCGETFKVEDSRDPKKYIKNYHHYKNKNDDTSIKISKSLKKHLSSLSKEEHSRRIKNSFQKCDQEKRAKKISLAKKGKKTNQLEIMGKKYACMSNEEFNSFLETKKPNGRKRLINLRAKYYGI